MDDDVVQKARFSNGHPQVKAQGKLIWNEPSAVLVRYFTSPSLGQHDNQVQFRTIIVPPPRPPLSHSSMIVLMTSEIR